MPPVTSDPSGLSPFMCVYCRETYQVENFNIDLYLNLKAQNPNMKIPGSITNMKQCPSCGRFGTKNIRADFPSAYSIIIPSSFWARLRLRFLRQPIAVFNLIEQARSRCHAGEWLKAEAIATEAIQAEPDIKDAFMIRAIACNAMGDFAGAIADCKKVIEIDPTSQDAGVFLFQCDQRLRRSKAVTESTPEE